MSDYTANLATELQDAADAVRSRLAAELRIDVIDESRRLNSAVRAALTHAEQEIHVLRGREAQ